MKIGYVVKRYPRYSETFIVSEILAHESAGADVRIFALRPSFDTHFQDALSRVRAPVKYLTFENLRVSDFWSYTTEAAAEFPRAASILLPGLHESPVEVCQGIALAREAIAAELDHLHAHFATSATSVARIASLLSGIPYTFTAHAKDVYHADVDAASLAKKLDDAQMCVTVSDFNVAYLEHRFDAARGRIFRVYNGIDLSECPYSTREVRDRTIVSVGRLVEKKGFSDLIAACGVLRDRGDEFTCRIIGAGPLAEELQEQIHRTDLGDRVTLLGPRPQSAVIEEVQKAAVLAAPCVVASDGDRDGLPTVVLEAMALGTACVGTPVTGIPEAIVDGRTGLIVAERDPVSLAGALGRLLNDPSLRVRLARGARALVEREFDIHRNAAQLRKLFAGMLKREQLTQA